MTALAISVAVNDSIHACVPVAQALGVTKTREHGAQGKGLSNVMRFALMGP